MTASVIDSEVFKKAEREQEELLFRDASKEVYDFKAKILKSNDKKNAATYINALYNHLTSNTVLD